jgi:hypothetical protein
MRKVEEYSSPGEFERGIARLRSLEWNLESWQALVLNGELRIIAVFKVERVHHA